MFTKTIAMLLGGCGMALLGCAEPPDPAAANGDSDEILANLVEAGFPASDLRVVDGAVYAGGDARVSLAASREMLRTDGTSTREQYRTTNLISRTLQTLCIDGSAYSGLFGAALDQAITNYNDLSFTFSMRRTAGAEPSCSALITARLIPGAGGFAGFPSEGMPFPEINVGTDIAALGLDVLEQVITHELGHTLGLRHSDYYDRSISCGVGGDEGAGGAGAILIPGTPSTAVAGGSVMNSCYRDIDTGEFTVSDVATLSSLYSLPQIWYATQWSPSYGNAAGWHLAESNWGAIEYPDLDGNGKADVCGRSISGIACALSNGSGFQPASQWTSEYGNATGWNLAEAYWKTIRYADVNGDGRADVCGRATGGILCALSNGTSFGTPSLWTPGYNDASGWTSAEAYWGTIAFPDVNGDGKADVCGRASSGILCGLSNGASFGAVASWTAGYSDAGGWSTSESYWGTIAFPDVNGDGKADVCGRSSGGVQCGLSSGAGFGAVSLWTAGYSDAGGWSASESFWRTIAFPDINGDGKADVCGRASAGVACATSLGGSFGAVSTWSTTYSDAASWNVSPAYWGTISFPDTNGDGRADVCGRNALGVNCGISVGNSFLAHTLQTRAFSDRAGWLASPAQWRTIRFPDLDGDGDQDICSRATDGINCGR